MKTWGLITIALLALSTTVYATVDDNELVNSDFSNGLSGWHYDQGEVTTSEYGAPEWSVQCNHSTGTSLDDWDDRVWQVVDDTNNPWWNPDWHKKIVNLEADISIDVKEGAVGGVRFRLDWWDESLNDDPAPPPPSETDPRYFHSDWVTYLSTEGYGVRFQNVKPFQEYVTHDLLGLPIQPRWLSVEIEFHQPNNVINRVDNVVLTSKCVPEPSMMVTLLTGIAGFATLKKFKRK